MTASSQPKLWVIHILVINLRHTSIVAGPKIAQLMPMSIGPKCLAPLEGSTAVLAIGTATKTQSTLRPENAATVQSSLGVSGVGLVAMRSRREVGKGERGWEMYAERASKEVGRRQRTGSKVADSSRW